MQGDGEESIVKRPSVSNSNSTDPRACGSQRVNSIKVVTGTVALKNMTGSIQGTEIDLVTCACRAPLVRDEPVAGPLHMTRYTNSGRKRTYLQASFDPNDLEILTTAASAPGLDSSQEIRAGASPEPSRKRRRKSKVGSEEKALASTAAVESDVKDRPVVKSEKTIKGLAKLKAKERAKRAKSTLSYL
jgi:hypothetical protein